ncbi:peptidoglycan D,D-transpeptidase FtsI family protein [Microbacterium arborescens]|uniref:peptidoglycan D,D-transpeptidase FtsI family protein n=1 Tax=Microbacterium arborescens TaxID=33883 RepID=UPI003C78499C
MTTRATRSPRRRTVVALLVVLIVLVAFIVRLVDIQVVNADEHETDARNLAMEAGSDVFGTRGNITDTNGATLATTTSVYDAKIDPKLAAQGIKRKNDAGETITITWPELAAEIAAVTGQDAAEVEGIVTTAVAADPESRFAYLDRGISTAQYRALADLKLPFVGFDANPHRTYPDGAVAGNVIGFVGSDEAPLEGMESLQNSCLQSSDGKIRYMRGLDGVVIPGTEVQDPAPVDGGTLRLTIDRDLQWYMQQLIAEQSQNLGAESGSILVVEVATGKIRAAAEYPSVDLNDIQASDPADRGSRLFRDSYEPGSTFKPVTAATAIEAAGLTPLSTAWSPDRMEFPNGAVVNDSEHHEAQNLTLTGGLVTSSNVALSQFGSQVDPETRLEYLKKFGVGEGTALNWSGEPKGTYIPTDQWDNQTYYTTTFGQAFTVTAPQVASVYQTIANGGVREPLSLVESCTAADGTVTEPELPDPVRVIQESTASQVSTMLENVFAQGTLAEDIAIPGYRMAGKTGTAQKVDPNTGAYKDNLYYTSLVGYAPADDPKYVVLTAFDEPKTLRLSAANRPAFQKAMTQVLKHYRIMPSDSQTPLLPVTQ